MKIIMTIIMIPLVATAMVDEDFPVIEQEGHFFQVTDMEHLHNCPACWEDEE